MVKVITSVTILKLTIQNIFSKNIDEIQLYLPAKNTLIRHCNYVRHRAAGIEYTLLSQVMQIFHTKSKTGSFQQLVRLFP